MKIFKGLKKNKMGDVGGTSAASGMAPAGKDSGATEAPALPASSYQEGMAPAALDVPSRPGKVWHNWPGNVTWSPERILEPSSTEELAASVRAALADDKKLKVVGSGFSWTGITSQDEGSYLVKLTNLAAVEHLQPLENGQALVTVGAGKNLRELSDELYDRGYVLQNLGTVMYQTVGGVMSTNTHGTGIEKGGFATQVEALEFVDGTGQVRTVSKDKDPQVFDAVRSGLGLAGIASKITLRVEPRFNVQAKEARVPVSEVLDQANIDRQNAENEWFQFSVFPYSDRAYTVTANRTDAPATRKNGHPAQEDFVLRCVEKLQTKFITRAAPMLVPAAARMAARMTPQREYVDRPYETLTHETRTNGCGLKNVEYFFPAEHTAEVVAEMRTLMDNGLTNDAFRTNFPLLFRFMKGDTTMMSYAYSENPDQRFAAVTVFYEEARGTKEDFFAGLRQCIERVLARHGREGALTVHLGKEIADFTPDEVQAMFPRIEEFDRVRAELDPTGVFLNSFGTDVLGLGDEKK